MTRLSLVLAPAEAAAWTSIWTDYVARHQAPPARPELVETCGPGPVRMGRAEDMPTGTVRCPSCHRIQRFGISHVCPVERRAA